MLEFIKMYYLDILVVLGAIIGLTYMYYIGKKDVVRQIVLDVVVEAEQVLGRGTGKLKYAYVVNAVHARLPLVLTVFITKKKLNELIEDGVYVIKDYLDNGLLDQSYIIEEAVEINP